MRKILAVMIFILITGLFSCSGAEVPTDDAVIEAYHSATKSASWFRISSSDVDFDIKAEVDGDSYYKSRLFETYAEFIAHIESLFSKEIVDEFLKNDQYIDYNDDLYAIPADRGTNIGMGKESYEVIKESGKKFIIKVTVEVLDYSMQGNADAVGDVIGSEVFEFPYELIDGKWVFTEFPEIR